MAITVETGAIVAGAETYVSVVDADLYHSNRNNTAWAALATAAKEAALRISCAYLDGKYRLRWKGRKVQPVTQPLEWPRGGVAVVETSIHASAIYDTGFAGQIFIPNNTIPQRMKDAQCELALKSLSGELAPDYVAGVVREKLDVIETQYSGAANAGVSVYQAIEQMISDYITPMNCNEIQRG